MTERGEFSVGDGQALDCFERQRGDCHTGLCLCIAQVFSVAHAFCGHKSNAWYLPCSSLVFCMVAFLVVCDKR